MVKLTVNGEAVGSDQPGGCCTSGVPFVEAANRPPRRASWPDVEFANCVVIHASRRTESGQSEAPDVKSVIRGEQVFAGIE